MQKTVSFDTQIKIHKPQAKNKENPKLIKLPAKRDLPKMRLITPTTNEPQVKNLKSSFALIKFSDPVEVDNLKIMLEDISDRLLIFAMRKELDYKQIATGMVPKQQPI